MAVMQINLCIPTQKCVLHREPQYLCTSKPNNFRKFLRQKINEPESVATLPPFSPIEGQKWFDQISSQWESQKNRFALIYFGKIQFLPPCIWNLPFMSTASEEKVDNLKIFFATVK
jgi:hypothetical protein